MKIWSNCDGGNLIHVTSNGLDGIVYSNLTSSGTNRCKVFYSKNRPKIDQNRNKMQKRPRAPEGVTKRSVPSRAQLLGSSWDVGRSWVAPGYPEGGQERPNSSPKPIFCVFFERQFSHQFLHRNFNDFLLIFRSFDP